MGCGEFLIDSSSGAYCRCVRWDRLFDDLEAQASAEWEAERAALASEAERVRFARVTLRERLFALREQKAHVRADLAVGSPIEGSVVAVGADWVALDRGTRSVSIVSASAIVALRMPHPDLLHSAGTPPRSELRERLSLGFVLRDLARRRVPVLIELSTGDRVAGTVDRAGADHLDLALHDLAVPRHPAAVTAFRIVPCSHVVQIVIAADDASL